MPDKGNGHRLILCNDGGTLIGPTEEAPMGANGLARLTIGPLIDTMIDTLYWQLGTDPYIGAPQHRFSDIYSHKHSGGAYLGDRSRHVHHVGTLAHLRKHPPAYGGGDQSPSGRHRPRQEGRTRGVPVDAGERYSRRVGQGRAASFPVADEGRPPGVAPRAGR